MIGASTVFFLTLACAVVCVALMSRGLKETFQRLLIVATLWFGAGVVLAISFGVEFAEVDRYRFAGFVGFVLIANIQPMVASKRIAETRRRTGT